MSSIGRKIVAALLFTIITVSVFFGVKLRGKAEDFTGSAQCMIVLECASGRVLNEKNADLRRPMASTTKIATAITVIENVGDLDAVVQVPAVAQGVEGSSIYLKAGEKLKVIDLLYGLMLQSGNDCAVALAIITAGNVDEFARLMNETAKKAGANDTNFVNPHGLHDDRHYTTARDLAKITAYAMKNNVFRKIVSTQRYVAPWEGHDYDRVIVNKNKLLTSLDGADGVKTGYTKKAGRCLVASATRNGMSVIAVVLNCGPMFEDCKSLIQQAYSDYEMVNVYSELSPLVTATVEGGEENETLLGVEKEVLYPLSKSEKALLKFEVENVSSMHAPVKIGTENGKIKFYSGNKLLFEQKLFTIKEVESLSVRDKLGEILKGWND